MFSKQNDLDNFAEWNDTWQRYLNISKCKHLALDGPSNDQFYTLAPDAPIQEVGEECDLGITFTIDFKFSKHINLSIHKVNKMLGIIIMPKFQLSHSHCVLQVICKFNQTSPGLCLCHLEPKTTKRY